MPGHVLIGLAPTPQTAGKPSKTRHQATPGDITRKKPRNTGFWWGQQNPKPRNQTKPVNNTRLWVGKIGGVVERTKHKATVVCKVFQRTATATVVSRCCLW